MAFDLTAEFMPFIPSLKRKGASACFSKTSRMIIGKPGKIFESTKGLLINDACSDFPELAKRREHRKDLAGHCAGDPGNR